MTVPLVLPSPDQYGDWRAFAKALVASLDGAVSLPALAQTLQYNITHIEPGSLPPWPEGFAPIWLDTEAAELYLANPAYDPPTAPDIVFIDTQAIADAAIETAKIDSQAVIESKIADAAVGTTKIANLAVTGALIANLAVGTGKIADLAVSTAKIANSAIVEAKIGNLEVTTAKINSLAVNEGKIANVAVTSGKIANLAVGAAHIQLLAVTAAQIANTTITGAKIANATIDTAQIANGAITNALIANATILDAKIVSVSAAKLVAGTIIGGDIYAGDTRLALHGTWSGAGKGALVGTYSAGLGGTPAFVLGWIDPATFGFQLRNASGKVLVDHTATLSLAEAATELASLANDSILSPGEKANFSGLIARLVTEAEQAYTRLRSLGQRNARGNLLHTTTSFNAFSLTGVTKEGASTAASPFSGFEAWLFTVNSGAGAKRVRRAGAESVSANTITGMAITAKYVDGDHRYLVLNPGDGPAITFDMLTGALAGSWPAEARTFYSVPLKDGWFRYYYFYRARTTGAADYDFMVTDTTASTTATSGSTGGNVYLADPQACPSTYYTGTDFMPYLVRTSSGSDVSVTSTSTAAEALNSALSNLMLGLQRARPHWQLPGVHTYLLPPTQLLLAEDQFQSGNWAAAGAASKTPSTNNTYVNIDDPGAGQGELRQDVTVVPGSYYVSLDVFKSATQIFRFAPTNQTAGSGLGSIIFNPASGEYIGASWTIIDNGNFWTFFRDVTMPAGGTTFRFSFYPAHNTILDTGSNSNAVGAANITSPLFGPGSLAQGGRQVAGLATAVQKGVEDLWTVISEYDAKRSDDLILAPAQVIEYTYTGNTTAQLPKMLTNVVKRGTVDVTSSASFTFTPAGCTVDTTGASNGQIRLTDVTSAAGFIFVQASIEGKNLQGFILVSRVLGPPPVIGGGGAGTTGFGPIAISASVSATSGSPANLWSGYQMRTNGSGQVRLSISLNYQVGDGQSTTGNVTIQFQRSADGSTGWTNVGSAQTGSTSTGGYMDSNGEWVPGQPGALSYSALLASGSANTDYYYRCRIYKTGTPASIGVNGTSSGAH